LVAEIDWQPVITADTVVPEDESSDEDIGPGDTFIELPSSTRSCSAVPAWRGTSSRCA
jgi:hypothetical protein